MEAALNKAIGFLRSNGGPVIQYRLRKEILGDLSPEEEREYLEQIFQTPHMQRLMRYRKENGYIGLGMHSGDKYKECPLEDGEAAGRLLAYYGIPRDCEVVGGFAAALQDQETLEEAFSYSRPEKNRYALRHVGTSSGSSLQLLVDTVLALLGFGDEGCIDETIDISFEAFRRMGSVEDLNRITKFNPDAKRSYNYPYIEAEDYYPCMYHLEVLANTYKWRSRERQGILAEVLNHMNDILQRGSNIHVRLASRYYVPLWALREPVLPFGKGTRDTMLLRKLTEIAKLGIGPQVKVARQTYETVLDELDREGMLTLTFGSAYEKRRYRQSLEYPTPYSEVALETDYKSDIRLWCDTTFWAVQFCMLYENGKAG